MRWFLVLILGSTLVAGTADARSRGSGGGGYGYTNPRSEPVRPYTRRDGRSVPVYHRTAPNGTDKDNYGTRPNTNPWTGRQGTRSSKSP